METNLSIEVMDEELEVEAVKDLVLVEKYFAEEVLVHMARISGLAQSGSNHFWSGSGDMTFKIWDVETETWYYTIECFEPIGRMICTGQDRNFIVAEIGSNSMIFYQISTKKQLNYVTFSPFSLIESLTPIRLFDRDSFVMLNSHGDLSVWSIKDRNPDRAMLLLGTYPPCTCRLG